MTPRHPHLAPATRRGATASTTTRRGRARAHEQWNCRHCGRSFGEDFTRCCAHEQQCRGLTRW